MFGGFGRDNNTASNRTLLKGKSSGTYQNFDKSYITNYIISRKPLIFKEANPEYLETLKIKLAVRRKKEIKRKIKIAVISIVITASIFLWVFL